jgi:hypothetical protein
VLASFPPGYVRDFWLQWSLQAILSDASPGLGLLVEL